MQPPSKKFFHHRMSLLLSLEASDLYCSAALHEEGNLIAAERVSEPRMAASLLAPAVKKLLEDHKITFSQLRGVAIGSGPGSYTGLRITSSLAKGICSALGIPLLAVNTLSAMTEAVMHRHGFMFFCPALDARRNEVYFQVHETSGNVVVPVTNLVVEKNSFSEQLEQGHVLFFGSGARKIAEITGHPNAVAEDMQPDAAQVGKIGFEKWKAGEFESLEFFEPFYLKEFVAGRKPGGS
jgi:tRNA threonylcarbamoyladenosine biosynthesis protein TsaB